MRRYDARLVAQDPEGALRRLLLGPAGTFLTNTPVFLLPGRVNLQPKHRVLDLQGGRGAIARFLAARIPFHEQPVALDASMAALRLARRDLGPRPAVDIVAGRPTRLPFADAAFDLVIAAHLFRRLTDEGLVVCMSEVERVLRPGGVLVGWDFASLSSRALNRLHLRLLATDPRPPRLRGFGPLAHYAAEAGFVRIERPMLRPFLFPPIPHTAILAQKSDMRGGQAEGTPFEGARHERVGTGSGGRSG
jgi:SAM-dependent methyltransferase